MEDESQTKDVFTGREIQPYEKDLTGREGSAVLVGSAVKRPGEGNYECPHCRGLLKAKHLVRYTCEGCSRLDLQVSMCLQALASIVQEHLGGDMSVLEELDPLLLKLLEERGHPVPIIKNQTVSPTKQPEHQHSSLQLRLPTLEEAELFGDPEARWSETYSLTQTGRHQIALNGPESKKTIYLDMRDGRIIKRIDHGLENVFGMAEFGGHQVYACGDGRLRLFREGKYLLEAQDKFMPWLNLPDGIQLPNYSRCLKPVDSLLYFIGPKGNVLKLDIILLVRQSENRRSYTAESLATGSVTDFICAGKNKVIGISQFGVITVTEGSRIVKQTGRLAEEEIFTCIAEVDEKILTASYDPYKKRTSFRLLAPDLRDLSSLPVPNQHSVVRHIKVFQRRSIPHVIAVDSTTSVHLLVVMGLRLLSNCLRVEIDLNCNLHIATNLQEDYIIVAGGQYSELKRLKIIDGR